MQLTQIHVYPVKSLAGFQVVNWPVDDRGLLYDRKWMLIDENNLFLSQRRLPAMALIHTRIGVNQLILSAPGQNDLTLPLHPQYGEALTVEIWGDRCLARTVDSLADDWLSRFLGQACRLVYQPDDSVRPVDPRYARPDDTTGFSDGFPLLIVSENSLNSLNQALAEPVSMERFRPNLVVNGCKAYEEDRWRRIAIGDIGFRLPKPCSRCSVPAINPVTATVEKEPLLTLNRLRRWDGKIYFGQNALHDNNGTLKVGDPVDILETGSLQPPLLV